MYFLSHFFTRRTHTQLLYISQSRQNLYIHTMYTSVINTFPTLLSHFDYLLYFPRFFFVFWTIIYWVFCNMMYEYHHLKITACIQFYMCHSFSQNHQQNTITQLLLKQKQEVQLLLRMITSYMITVYTCVHKHISDH